MRGDAIASTTDAAAVVVDAFGDSGAGLHRPGARYLHAGHRTVDHAVQTTLAAMRDEAYRSAESEASNAWKGSNDREIVAKPITGDARADSYEAYDDYMA